MVLSSGMHPAAAGIDFREVRMQIEIKKMDREEAEKKGITTWSIWEKEVSRFDWHYDSTEECYLLEGQVTVETAAGEKATFGAGDFVRFPKGLDCVWDIRVPVKKHFNFK
jgi:uncharacterized cupin superfamily protein